MAWITPIIDRTETDVVNRTSKGVLNAVDLNRIENNIDHTAGLFGITLTSFTLWTRLLIPDITAFTRIRSNLTALNDVAYYAGEDIPELPYNTYIKFNAIESILISLYNIGLSRSESFNYTGEGYSGEQIGVI